MAHSSTALREPTMNDILTSIREIIEENYSQSNINNADIAASSYKDSPSEARNYKEATGYKETTAFTRAGGNAASPASPGATSANSNNPLSQQERDNVLSVAQAMDVLADSIGLSREVGASVMPNQEQNFVPAAPAVQNIIEQAIDREAIFQRLSLATEETLRPIIANWLRDNFMLCFDKILREEIKKVLK